MADISGMAVTFVIWAAVAAAALFVFIAISVGTLFAYRWFKYKVRVEIYEQVGEGYISKTDMAQEMIQKIEGDKKKTYLRLRKGFKGIKKVALPNSSEFIPQGSRKKINLLFKDAVFAPLPIKQNSPETLTFNPTDLLRVLHIWDSEHSINAELHRPEAGWWNKWGQYATPIILLFMFLTFTLIIFIVASGQGNISAPQIIT